MPVVNELDLRSVSSSVQLANRRVWDPRQMSKRKNIPGLVVLLTVCWFSLYKVRGIPIVGAQCPAHSAQPPPRVRTEANLTLNPPTSVSIWNGCVCEVEVSLVGIYRGGTTTFRFGQW